MRVLGLDPSLTNFGWALHDTNFPTGTAERCPDRGRFQTPSKMEFIDRYISQRNSLRDVVQRLKPDRVGLEFPVFKELFSEGMYGLFLFCCEALKEEGCDVVFWTPLQIKAHARELVVRPPKWKMDKTDMVEAAKLDTGTSKVWNHNEADAYHAARLSSRFWLFLEGSISESQLTEVELKLFALEKTFSRGKHAGLTVKRGQIFREDERFFLWSK